MSKLKEKVLLNIVLPMAEGVMGLRACKWHRQILKMNQWSHEEIVAWQNEQLQKFVNISKMNMAISFYQSQQMFI